MANEITRTITTPDGTVTVTHADGLPPPPMIHRGDGDHFPAWLFVLTLFVIAGLIRTAIRALAGDTCRGRRAEKMAALAGGIAPGRQTELLVQENEKLRGQVTRLEERVAVLERIVTDPARRVADEIESLR